MLSVLATPTMPLARPRCRVNQWGTMIHAAGMSPCLNLRVRPDPMKTHRDPAEKLSDSMPIAEIAIITRPPHVPSCLPIASTTRALKIVAAVYASEKSDHDLPGSLVSGSTKASVP